MRPSRQWVLISLFLAACAAPSLPPGYTGPTATIRDSAFAVSGTHATFFYVSEIDGRHIETSIDRTRKDNRGATFSLMPTTIERQVPAGQPIRVKLEGRHVYGTPVQEILMAASSRSVTRIVEFTPRPGWTYWVEGDLRDEGAGVWLRDPATNEHISRTSYVH